MPKIIVDIDVDAQVKVEAQGVHGQGCAALTKAIENALGKTTSDLKKSEFYQQEKANVGNKR